MLKRFEVFLWALKLGALVNLYFLVLTFLPPLVAVDSQLLIPARILFAVSAFRCLFPVRYKDNIVFHDSPLSSIFLTRLFATFSEVALIYQLAYLIRLANAGQFGWVNILSWLMVAQVVLSQVFVWGAILKGNLKLFFYEEMGWGLIYAANTIASVFLYIALDDLGGRAFLIFLNLLFGAVYLPWQLIHLRVLWSDARKEESKKLGQGRVTENVWVQGLRKSIRVKNPTSDPQAWGGLVGVIWMASYWAALIPVWVYLIITKA